ncbi:CBM96 family carbohydrate-binding protein [Reichenbachiella versicolor]|uniref:CBM96 family carbohydrate-binding protein n=1 Tax=Reichenbachiella versicolor TaxID=1821036 RepID=UPI000D6E32E8|nr:DNRLRE domain-containing protein [Reichenbachiella versicolor]
MIRNFIILRLYLIASALLMSSVVSAQSWGYNNHRIAVSADGNNQPDVLHRWKTADPDDWGGTPAALAMIAKLKLQDKLVHYSYNNFIDSPPHTTAVNEMKIGVDGGINRWGFDASRFFDVSANNTAAINHLATELGKSTSSNRLYFIHMGPAEFLYRAVAKTIANGKISALSHVYLVSHSGYNENHLRRGDPNFDLTPVPASQKHHTWAEVQELSGNRIKYTKIKDQNGSHDPNVLWQSDKDWTVWHWMRDHADPNVAWLYQRMRANAKNSADISDAGMLYWLLVGDENGSPSKFETFIGNGIEVEDSGDCGLAESNGLLIIEGESFPTNGGWEIASDPVAAGGQYIQFMGANHYNSPNPAHNTEVKFQITTTGNYNVFWNMRQPDHAEGDKSNDAWLDFPDAIQTAKGNVITGFHKFVGRSKQVFGFNGALDIHSIGSAWLRVNFPTPGEYTLRLSGRSEEFQLDRIVIALGRTREEMEAEASVTAETRNCVQIDEDISLANIPSSISNSDLEVPVTVSYTADGSRDINVALKTPGETFITSKKVTVPNGSGQVTITVPLAQALSIANNYIADVSIRPVGTSWQSNIKTVRGTFDVKADAVQEAVSVVQAPTSVSDSQTDIAVTIAYTADGSRDLNVGIRSPQDAYIANKQITVPSGTGQVAVTVSLANPLPAASGYIVDLALRPVGGNWQTNLVRNKDTTFDVGSTAVSETFTLNAIQDVYLQGSTRYNTIDLRVEDGNRVSYLKYNLSSVTGQIATAKLTLGVGSDAGSGVVEILKGSSNSWTETNLSTSNAPASAGVLASKNATYSVGQSYTFDLDVSQIANSGYLSLIVRHGSGNDISFASSENANAALRPVLTIVTSGSSARTIEGLNESISNMKSVSFFPNPSKGVFKVECPKGALITLRNITGGLPISLKADVDNPIFDVSGIASGIYVIQISSEIGTTTSRLVIE